MSGIYPGIPSDVPGAPGPPRLPLDVEVKRRLVAAMYDEEIVGGSSSCILCSWERETLHHWLGAPTRVAPLGTDHYALERRNLSEWLP